jgi:hypothetical protein
MDSASVITGGKALAATRSRPTSVIRPVQILVTVQIRSTVMRVSPTHTETNLASVSASLVGRRLIVLSGQVLAITAAKDVLDLRITTVRHVVIMLTKLEVQQVHTLVHARLNGADQTVTTMPVLAIQTVTVATDLPIPNVNTA